MTKGPTQTQTTPTTPPAMADRCQVGEWYVISTYTGHEAKVKANLEMRVRTIGVAVAREGTGSEPEEDPRCSIRAMGRPDGRSKHQGISSRSRGAGVSNRTHAVIAHLDSVCEIVWCNTWLASANDDIATRLGVGPFPALHPLRISDWNWKPAAASEVPAQAAAAGREVFWIEDFCSNLPRDLAGPITFLDTAPGLVLTPALLPEALRPTTPLTGS